MTRSRYMVGVLSVGFLCAIASTPGATTIDGRLDPEYGAEASVQVNATSLGDTPPGYSPFDSLQASIGSELDAASGFVSGGVLYLFFAGNFKSYVGEPLILPDQLEVFIDCVPGGQNQLRADNPAVGPYLRLSDLAGLRFDAEFSPDYWLNGMVLATGPQGFFAHYADLPAGGGSAGYLLGRTDGGGPGILTGGTNPYGILASIDQRNRAGVTAGCTAGTGSGVTTGIELAIPLAAIGNPSGPIKVCALIDHVWAPQVSNQVLGPLPIGSCSLGAPGTIDFSGIPGQQYFAIERPTPARKISWGRVKRIYR